MLARGSVELADVIEEAVKKNGAIFDAWSEFFDNDIWSAAFAKFGYKDSDFAERNYDYDEKLPWDNIDVGVTKEFLWEEYQKSGQLIATPDCTGGECSSCGICDFDKIKK